MPKAPTKGSLAVIFLTVFIDLLGFGMVLPLLPLYARRFTVDETGLVIGLLMASFSAMQFIFAPVWGRISDRIGRRPVLIIGLAGSVGFYTLFGLATLWESLTWLFVARIGAGVAGATISTAQAYIADSTSLENRAKGMALIGAAFGLGFTFGPLLAAAALLAEGDVETSPLPGFAAAGISAVALLLAIFRLPESLDRSQRAPRRHWFDLESLRAAMAVPSIAALLVTTFASVLSFGAFEQTLSLLLKDTPFEYTLAEVLLVYAYVGVVLSVAQGVIVRRLAGRLSEAVMAVTGIVTSIGGLIYLAQASAMGSTTHLLLASTVEVTGFALVTPSIQSLISRRSDPRRQGGVLGVSQSVSSLGRIVGPMISVPLFHVTNTLPYWVAVAIMGVALGLLGVAIRTGRDYQGD